MQTHVGRDSDGDDEFLHQYGIHHDIVTLRIYNQDTLSYLSDLNETHVNKIIVFIVLLKWR